MKTILDLILEKNQVTDGKPARDVLRLLLAEAHEEGPGNDGLLATYIREAAGVLTDLLVLIDEESLFEKLLAGQSVTVEVVATGARFIIRPAAHNPSGLPAYDAVGMVGVRDRLGVILGRGQLREWLYGLREVTGGVK